MAKKKKQTIGDQLLAAIHDSGLSIYRIAKDSGVSQPAVQRFASGKTDLRLETASKLAAYFQMELTPPKFPKRP